MLLLTCKSFRRRDRLWLSESQTYLFHCWMHQGHQTIDCIGENFQVFQDLPANDVIFSLYTLDSYNSFLYTEIEHTNAFSHKNS